MCWSRASAPPVSSQGRAARGEIDDAKVAPEDAVAETGAQRLGAGLLGGESLGITRRPRGTPVGAGALEWREHAVEEAVAEALDGAFDAADVDEIAAEPQ